MADEQQRARAFITPPPGLLPDAPARDELEGTDSGTRRVDRESPVFFARPPGAAPAEPQTLVVPDGEPNPASDIDAGLTPVVASIWALETPDGRTHPIPADGLVIGRNPAAPEGWEGATLLGVLDPEKTVSKTHAALRADEGGLSVIDLASTNGTTVGGPDGTETSVGAEQSVGVVDGSTIGFGSYAVRVLRS